MKKLIGLIAVLAIVITLGACDYNRQDNDAAAIFMAVDINPSVEFILDEEEIVRDVIAVNEEAAGIVEGVVLTGKTASEALERFLREAIDAGFIDAGEEANAVFITAEQTGDENEERGAFEQRMKDHAKSFMENEGINSPVLSVQLSEELLELAEENDISEGRMRLIQSALNIDESLTLEDALELEMHEIMMIIRDNHRERIASFRQNRLSFAETMRERARGLRDRFQDGPGAFIPGPSEGGPGLLESIRDQVTGFRDGFARRGGLDGLPDRITAFPFRD